MDILSEEKTCVWNNKVQNTQLEMFKNIINTKYSTKFKTYWDLHKWSIKNYSKFWEEILIYFNYIYTGSYQKVAKRKSMITDIDWFSGAKMNYAENLLRHKDNKIALICIDKEDNEEIITYSQLYNQAKTYAVAFKRLGLQKGDTVAYYMHNQKEAVFAMLGTNMLGGIWCSTSDFNSIVPKNVIKQINPKFLITVSKYTCNGKVFDMLEAIPTITNDLTSLMKIIIIPSKYESALDVSRIKKSCVLQEFLDGKNCYVTNDEVSFQQLPFNHPITVTFTSGTTGTPKGLVHSAATLLPMNRYYGLHLNITEKDVIMLDCNPRWITWKHRIINLMFGATIVLYNGHPFYRCKPNYWDLLAKYKVTYIAVSPYFVDSLEKSGVVPGRNCNLQNLRIVTIGGSPVKLQNYNYIHRCIKHDNFLIGVSYGATETHGSLSGFDTSIPVYSGQIQVPALGVDLKCYDKHGNSIVGCRGELVIASPLPNLPLGLWDDRNNERFTKLYFSKYNGEWIQNDEGWIDPETMGIIIVGRSDDTVKLRNDDRANSTDIYFCIHSIEELDDYLCIGRTNFKTGYSGFILFVKLKLDHTLSEKLVMKIKAQIKTKLTTFHVPEIILEVPEIPYNLNNKRMECLVKEIVSTNCIPHVINVRNPECLKMFLNIPELQIN